MQAGPSTLHPPLSAPPRPSNGGPAVSPLPKPPPLPSIPPFERIDTLQIKKQLHDELGEDGLKYWTAFQAYIKGSIARAEFMNMGRAEGWLNGSKRLRLHNQLISSMLHNASSPYGSNIPPHTPLSANSKRKRQEGDEALSTIDESNRVQSWVLGLPRKERVRVKKLIEKEYDAALAVESGIGVRESARGRTKRRNKMDEPLSRQPCVHNRTLPSATELQQRMATVAKEHGLSGEAGERVGEFVALALDAHLKNLFHSATHLLQHDRPSSETIHLPSTYPSTDETTQLTLADMQALLTIAPSLHPRSGPALYKLATGVSLEEPSTATSKDRAEHLTKSLLAAGLLKVDKAGDDEGAKKHNFHWKYEDPAVILRDFFG